MPPPDPVIHLNDIYRTRCRGSYYGERFEIDLHWWNITFGDISVTQIATGMRNGFLTQLGAILSSNVKWDEVCVCKIHPSPKGFEFIIPITPLFGVGSNEDLPTQCAYLMKIHTQTNARHRKGRHYLPGILRSHFQNNGWTNICISQMNSIKNILINSSSLQSNFGVVVGVLSRGDHDTPFAPMTDLTWSSYPCVMRSRRPSIS
jgi:hypothetical protein